MITGPFRYLIGGNDLAQMHEGCHYEFSYDASRGDTAYCNLRDEKGRFHSLDDANNRGRYAPYLPPDDISIEYGEYCPDPVGDGYMRNIEEQVQRKLRAGCVRIELDNPDTRGLMLADVLHALDYVDQCGMTSAAKNPLFVSDPMRYASHPSVDMIICERDGRQTAGSLEWLRQSIHQPDLAVRFVAFEDGIHWAESVASEIRHKGLRNMGVTISRVGEYVTATDLIVPRMCEASQPEGW